MADSKPGVWRFFSPRHIATVIGRKGMLWTLGRAVCRVLQIPFKVLRVPLANALAARGVRAMPINCLRCIGHFVVEPDCYIKEELLGLHPRYYTVILAPKPEVANTRLLQYWRRYFPIISSPSLCFILEPVFSQPAIRYETWDYAATHVKTAQMGAIYAQWGDRQPLLKLTESDRRRGRQWLSKMGMPENAWFVCVHVRQAGGMYYYADFRYRDADVLTYQTAMEAIVEAGGWCIRMGDPSMPPLPPMRNCIDYAHGKREPLLDVFLCASCRFFLGSDSGLFLMSCVFGVPVAATNMVPYGMLPPGVRDLVIHKKMWSRGEGRLLRLAEIFNSPVVGYQRNSLFEAAGIDIIDNTPLEITELALEMLERTAGTAVYSEEDEQLQQAFLAHYKPGHSSYGSASRIGRSCLRQYRDELLETCTRSAT